MVRALLDGTCLRLPIMRLAPAMLVAISLAAGVSWPVGPARAANFNVGTDAQLRSAISSAGNGDTITFTGNITLGSNLPTVTKNVTVNGGLFTLSGDNKYRGLFVQSGTVAINDLAIKDAVAQGGRGGNGEEGGAGGGGAGLGGALFVASGAQVTVSNVSAQNGSARGGNGGNSGTGTGDTSGGGGGYWITGSDGGDAGFFASGGGGTGGGGDGFQNQSGANGGFGGGGGGSASVFGGTGGFGGGGGGGSGATTMPGGFGGGTGGAGASGLGGGGGGGGGLGGAIFVQQGGTLSLASSINVSGNTVAGGTGGSGHTRGQSGAGVGSGLFLGGNGTLNLTPGAGQSQVISDAIVDQTGAGGTGANAGSWSLVKDGAGTTTLTGNNAYSGGITVKAGVLQGSTAGLKGNILNNAAVVFDQAGAGTYAGAMSGTGALTVRGTGAVTFTGTNTYSGPTTVNGGGTLLFTSDTALGAAGNGISLDNGTIGVGSGEGGQTFSRPVAIATTGAMFVGDKVASPVTWSGPISGAGRLVKSGLGQLVLSGVNTYQGGTVVGGGRLLFTSDANLGTAGTIITLENGGGIGPTKDAVAGLSMTRPIVLSDRGAITLGVNPLTWAGNITGDGQLIKGGLGVLTLTGATNTYTGGTFVAQGTLQIASDDKLGAAGTGVTLINGGNLWASGTFTTPRPFLLQNGGGAFQVDAGQTLTLSGDLQVATGSGLTKIGAGTLVLAGTSSTVGTIYQNGGTLQGNTSTVRGDIAFDQNAQNTIARSVTFDQAADGTFANKITGIGSLTKIGAGTLILGGDNSYSTGTTVSAGTLQGTSRSLQGAIANNAAVIFDQDFDGTYAGNMTGTGTLTKNGAGKLNFTGTSSVGGGTTINAGGFAVNGHLASNVTLNKGGTLSGSGNITGDINNNGGTIKPGNSIGHLTVDGNFTFNEGTYEVEIDPQGDSDRVSVVGAGHAVRIHAGTLQVVPHAGTYTPNTKYTIITTEAGGNVWVGDLAGGVGFLVPEASLDPDLHSIYLTLALPPDAFRSAGRTDNQQAVGGALDAIAAGGDVAGLVTTVANLEPSQGAAAFDALSGQPYADFGTVNVQASRLFMNVVGRQMAGRRGADVGAPSNVALAGACEAACDADAVTPQRFSAWLSGIGSTGGVDGDGNAADLSYTLGGTAFGVDYRLDPRLLVGVAGGYVGGSQSVDGFRGDGHTDALSVAVYGSFTQGAFYADVLAGYANASNDMQRKISLPGMETSSASGDTSANQFLSQIEAGYRIGLGLPADTSITPFGRLQIASVHQDGFTETGGSDFNLDVESQTTTSVRSTFGADLAAGFDLGGGGPLDVGVRVGWMHEFADTDRPITAAFAGASGPDFTVSGASAARDSAVIGVSAATEIAANTSLSVGYDGEVGGSTDNHQFRAVFRRTW